MNPLHKNFTFFFYKVNMTRRELFEMQQKKILIVEDDKKIALVLRDYLEKENFRVTLLHRGDGVLHNFRANPPDAILLDILLPGEDGLEVFKKLRAISNVPILFITARIENADRLLGLEMGADDYICKPFMPREVVARVKAVLRRAQFSPEGGGILVSGPIAVDLSKRQATIFESELQLTPVEFELLRLFISRPGQVFTRNDLIAAVRGANFIGFDRTVDSHICNLRKKISERLPEENLIHTVYGIGYSFRAAQDL